MKSFFKALSHAQMDLLAAQQEGSLRKDTSGYGYKYLALPDLLQVTTPILHKHGLVLSQGVDGDALVSTLFHWESGEFQEHRFPLKEVHFQGQNVAQAMGSVITYFRRYACLAILGLSPEDLDAETPQSIHDKQNQQRSSQRPPAQRPAAIAPVAQAEPVKPVLTQEQVNVLGGLAKAHLSPGGRKAFYAHFQVQSAGGLLQSQYDEAHRLLSTAEGLAGLNGTPVAEEQAKLLGKSSAA